MNCEYCGKKITIFDTHQVKTGADDFIDICESCYQGAVE
jgi:ribosome-binding protein aMBF1 (putative translation factor)